MNTTADVARPNNEMVEPGSGIDNGVEKRKTLSSEPVSGPVWYSARISRSVMFANPNGETPAQDSIMADRLARRSKACASLEEPVTTTL